MPQASLYKTSGRDGLAPSLLCYIKKTTRFAGGFLYITNSCNLGSGVDAVRGDLYKGKETFPHCQSLALRERWHFACEMTERVRHGRCRGFLVGAGVSASRAAKKAPLGLFCPAERKRRAAAVRIHPRGCVLGFLQKKKTSVFSTLVFLVGAGGFEQAALSPVASCLRSIQWFHAAFRTPTRTAVASTRTAVRIKVGYKVG